MCDEHETYIVCVIRRQNPESRIRSPCDDPAYSQWFSLWWPGTLPTSPKSTAESKIQNQKIDFPLGYVMTRHTAQQCRIQNSRCSLYALCELILDPEFYERGQNSKSTIRKGSLEEMVNGGQNPESRIMRGGWWLRKESRIQNSESGQGCERLGRKEKRIQNSELEGTLERERKSRISY